MIAKGSKTCTIVRSLTRKPSCTAVRYVSVHGREVCLFLTTKAGAVHKRMEAEGSRERLG